jgi:6-phosphogluconate dehydrogenase (decarboxylating)
VELGVIGGGRMGRNTTERLGRAGHAVIGDDQSLDPGHDAFPSA